MKQLLWVALLILSATTACTSTSRPPAMTNLETAENAYREGRYSRAQVICDSIALGSSFGGLDVDELCRLSMLFVHLGEQNGDEGGTTAMAARCLSAAFGRDTDSTVAIIRALPPEDRSRAMLLAALTEQATPGEVRDSIFIPDDSL